MRRCIWALSALLLVAGCEDDTLSDEETEHAAEDETPTTMTERDIREALRKDDSLVGKTATRPGMVVERERLEFPLPIMPGATESHVTRTHLEGQPDSLQLVFVSDASFDETVNFYDKVMKEKGLNVQRHSAPIGRDRQFALMGESSKVESTALISQSEKEEHPHVTISWSEKATSAPASAAS